MNKESSAVYVIAEAGVNHNGSEEQAVHLIDIAAKAGADAVKFQLFDPKALVTATAATAEYQAQNLNDNQISQQEMLGQLTLSLESYKKLAKYCKKSGMDFLCTPFDQASLKFLIETIRMPYLKLASGEVANAPLLLAAARSGLKVILSTGMSNLEEVEDALAVLQYGLLNKAGLPDKQPTLSREKMDVLRGKVTILHCVSQYPAPIASSNLRAMDTMRDAFGLPVGFSDHTLGIAMATAAVARGACMIEKHFTYDVSAKGPDHAASLSPEGLQAMIRAIREVEQGLGDGIKKCQPVEENTRDIARRSVVAAGNIAKGEVFSAENLICKRPATGKVAPARLWELLGKPAVRAYNADEMIDEQELKSV